jgi:hypothetical protein
VISEAAQVKTSVTVMVSDDTSKICIGSRNTYQMFGRILIVCLTYRVIVTFMAKFLNRSTRLLACLLTDYKLKKKRRTM